MDFIILDQKIFENKKWILCKGNLYDYISSLKRDFSEFQIQRRIVKNGYLDGILKTITEGEPMPTITLTCTQILHSKDNKLTIDPKDIEILDGLQRTFRLWVFWNISEIVKHEGIDEYKPYLYQTIKKMIKSGDKIVIQPNTVIEIMPSAVVL